MPIRKTQRQNGDDAQIDLRLLEAHFERQAVDPVVLAGPLQRCRFVAGRSPERPKAFRQHQPADGAEKDDIEQGDIRSN